MRLIAQDQRALEEALRGVVVAGAACAQQPDTDAVDQALDAVWHAVRRAKTLNREVAERASRAALQTFERVA